MIDPQSQSPPFTPAQYDEAEKLATAEAGRLNLKEVFKDFHPTGIGASFSAGAKLPRLALRRMVRR